jgi:hypothetical protein
MSGCTKPDASLKAALDELKRLNSYTETGLNFAQYQDRLLTSKANIDIALAGTNDVEGITKIQRALNEYTAARDAWKRSIEDATDSDDTLQRHWSSAAKYIQEASDYINADYFERSRISTRENQPADTNHKPTETPAVPAATPHPAKEAVAQALRLYPALGQKDSAMNKAFASLYEEARRDAPDSLAQPDWPLKLAARAASTFGHAAQPTPPGSWMWQDRDNPLERPAH